MRSAGHVALLGALVAACAGPVLAQRDLSQVEIEAVQVAGGVYMLVGAGGNIAVSTGEDGILIVDDQFAPLADKIRTALGELGGGKLAFVLNTHWHPDHTGANPVFGPEAPIIAHTNVRRRLATGYSGPERTIPPMAEKGLPVITFDDSLTVHFNGEEIRAIHFPHGHTDGDSVIFFTRAKVVHVGDLFFTGQFPFVDLASGGDVEGYARNVGAVLEGLAGDEKVIPGHGALSTVEDLRGYHRMLEATIAWVRARMEAGQPLEKIRGAGLPAEWDAWGGGWITEEAWIEAIHTSLSRAAR